MQTVGGGSKRRPREATHAVGWLRVSPSANAMLCHSGGLPGPGGCVGLLSAALVYQHRRYTWPPEVLLI